MGSGTAGWVTALTWNDAGPIVKIYCHSNHTDVVAASAVGVCFHRWQQSDDGDLVAWFRLDDDSADAGDDEQKTSGISVDVGCSSCHHLHLCVTRPFARPEPSAQMLLPGWPSDGR